MSLLAFLARRRFGNAARINRALAGTPATRIADAVEGEAVKIAGEVRQAGAPVFAPFSRTTCVFYRVVVEEGDLEGRWVELAREEAGGDFIVSDGSGNAVVGGAELALRRDAVFRSADLAEPTREQALFLGRHGITMEGLVFARNLRCSESRVEAGDRVAVAGRPRREPDPEPGGAGGEGGYREVPTRLVFRATKASPVLVSEDPAAIGGA